MLLKKSHFPLLTNISNANLGMKVLLGFLSPSVLEENLWRYNWQKCFTGHDALPVAQPTMP